jgi:hypothetical protein
MIVKREKSGSTNLRSLVTALEHVHSSIKDSWAQYSGVIAKPAVSAAIKAE